MLARLEYRLRRWRLRLSRPEWVIRLLRLPVSRNTEEEPGLVLIQIDGLAREEFERALEEGRLPHLKHLIDQQHYATHTFYPGQPSSTPAVQGELHYGVRSIVPAFEFLNPETGVAENMFNPYSAERVEREIEERGENGLLHHGSSWSNIYTGGADDDESHYCTAKLDHRSLFRSRPIVDLLTFPLLHFPSCLKIVTLVVFEILIAIRDLVKGVWQGESIAKELKFVLARVFICIGLRELINVGTKIDITRGLPVIHMNFLGYDEQAHRRGPDAPFAHWTLRGINNSIKNIHRCARRSLRRHYSVWVFSDHGQERTTQYTSPDGDPIETVLPKLVGLELKGTAAESRPGTQHGYLFTRRRKHFRAPEDTPDADEDENERGPDETIDIASMGPVALVGLRTAKARIDVHELATRLVSEFRVPGALFRAESGRITWIHEGGEFDWQTEAAAQLPHPDGIREAVVADLAALVDHPKSGDLLLLGWCPQRAPQTFAQEQGSHGGPGPKEVQGFALLPPHVRLPYPFPGYIRPEALRSAVQAHLHRGAPRFKSRLRPPLPKKIPLRVMSYNVHRCVGMDGRISPERIAEIIALFDPDVVALQELDADQSRTGGIDQARRIAELLDMHHAYCPTVVSPRGRYGHGLLSRYPLRIIKSDLFAETTRPEREPRGALWAQIEVDGQTIKIVNTHFGLRPGERLRQANQLLGPDWIGETPTNTPLVLCGDFNMSTRSAAYRRIRNHLDDAQLRLPGRRPLSTFSSISPLWRIDHIFISSQIKVRAVDVPRNFQTRVASDHLPLVADLVCLVASTQSPPKEQTAERPEIESGSRA